MASKARPMSLAMESSGCLIGDIGAGLASLIAWPQAAMRNKPGDRGSHAAAVGTRVNVRPALNPGAVFLVLLLKKVDVAVPEAVEPVVASLVEMLGPVRFGSRSVTACDDPHELAV